jgi:hypothetical protein
MNPAGPVLLLAALAGGPSPAQTAALTESPACRRALDALDALEATSAKDRAARPALEAARHRAAVACLGGRDAPASAPPRAAQPAVTPAPARPGPPIAIPMPVPASPRTPPPRPAPALTVTGCDATGCWASDGTRLQRVGPNLMTPGGHTCTTSGALLHCTR